MPTQMGRSDGELERRVGTRDEHKRATRSRPGPTRVRKSDEIAAGETVRGHPGDPASSPGPYESDTPAAKGLAGGTWVLVADSEKALFLRNETDAENPHLVVVEKDMQENPKDSEQGANKPGRMDDTGIRQRSSLDDTDWHRLAKERFAADLAEQLYGYAHRGAFDRLIIVAGPRVLGVLRDNLHKEVSDRVVAEIDSNLTGQPIDAIERHVAEALAQP
jgi:protein required for attachment to host cells